MKITNWIIPFITTMIFVILDKIVPNGIDLETVLMYFILLILWNPNRGE